jgi:hypothetical protein
MANKVAQKDMFGIIKYLSQRPKHGTKLKPSKLEYIYWTQSLYGDRDWVANKDTRRIVTGFAIFIQGA